MGAALAEVALEQDHDVTLADNWYPTRAEPARGAGGREGARVETADIRDPQDVERLLADGPDRVYLLAAQASRPSRTATPTTRRDERDRAAASGGSACGARAARSSSTPAR